MLPLHSVLTGLIRKTRRGFFTYWVISGTSLIMFVLIWTSFGSNFFSFSLGFNSTVIIAFVY